jgi:hypothetical protein
LSASCCNATSQTEGEAQVSTPKGIFLCVKALLVAAVFAFAAATPLGAGAATNQGCGAGALLLNVRYHVANDVDTGVAGNNWAFDSYTRTVRVWR